MNCTVVVKPLRVPSIDYVAKHATSELQWSALSNKSLYRGLPESPQGAVAFDVELTPLTGCLGFLTGEELKRADELLQTRPEDSSFAIRQVVGALCSFLSSSFCFCKSTRLL